MRLKRKTGGQTRKTNRAEGQMQTAEKTAEKTAARRAARKKIIVTAAGCAVVLCAFIGISRSLPRQKPIELVTVNDEVPTEEAEAPFEVAAKAAVLIDADTGEVLFQQNAHEELPPASVTKVMTMLLVMEAVDDGKISLDDQVTISQRAASMGGSQMYMEAGETHTVEELLKGVAMASANDGCVALAEYVAGTEEIFVERMNRRAEELGMRDTHFVNTNGLPVADHYSSAYDIAITSRELIRHEKTRDWFTTWQDSVTVGLPGKETEFGLTNTNRLIRQYQGCDGIKTGYTTDAGYCLSASATREDTRLIAVVLGCESSDIRNEEVSRLLDYGFANFQTHVVAEKGQVFEELDVEKGTPRKVRAVAAERITVLVEKGSADAVTTKSVIDDKVALPLVKGDEIGTLTVYNGEEVAGEYPLVADGDVSKASFGELASRFFEGLF